MNEVMSKEMNELRSSGQSYEKRYQGISLPLPKDENYRFLKLSSFPIELKKRRRSKPKSLKDENITLKNGQSGALLLRNQECVQKELSATLSKVSGLIFTDFKSMLQNQSQKIKENLKLPSVFENDKFANQAAARAENGVVVIVPPGTQTGPLHSGNWFDASTGAHFHRTLLIVEADAELTFIEEFAGSETSKEAYANALIQIVALPGSKVHYTQIQRWGHGTHFMLRQHFLAYRDAEIKVNLIHYGASRGQVRSEMECNGSGSSIRLQGASRGERDQQFDFWVSATHAVPDTMSAVDFWMVMADHSKAVFNGNLKIQSSGVRTSAYQINKNLILSDGATVDTLPKLEIDTDDVSCNHGASVSSVDPDQLYYLQSRGISEASAQKMIVDGFLAPVINEIPLGFIRQRVFSELTQKSHGDLLV